MLNYRDYKLHNIKDWQKLLVISFEDSLLEKCQELLGRFCELDLVTTMNDLESNEYSNRAIVYAMDYTCETHLHNISFIKEKFTDAPIFVLSTSVSIPLLLHTTHLHITDVYLLPLSDSNLQSLLEHIDKNTSIKCNWKKDSIPHDLTQGKLISETPMGSLLGIIEKEFRSGPTLSELSNNLHLSPSRLCHLFKDLCGITYSQYLMSRKLEESEKLLCEGQSSVSTIAYQVGFSNPSHFSRCFKEHFNVTPSSYLSGNREIKQSPLFLRYQRLRAELLPETVFDSREHSRLKVANGDF